MWLLESLHPQFDPSASNSSCQPQPFLQSGSCLVKVPQDKCPQQRLRQLLTNHNVIRLTYRLAWCLVPPGVPPGRSGIVQRPGCRTGCRAAGSSGGQPCYQPLLPSPSWGRRRTGGTSGGTAGRSQVPAPRRPSWRRRFRQKPSGLVGNPWLRRGAAGLESRQPTRLCVKKRATIRTRLVQVKFNRTLESDQCSSVWTKETLHWFS